MKKLIIAFMLTGIAMPFCKAQINCTTDELNQKIIAMENSEQAIRKKLMPALAQFQKDGSGQTEVMSMALEMNQIDEQNQNQLIEILQNCGWPEDLEENAHTGIFLILQHSPDSIMQQYYPQVKAMAQKGVLLPDDAATMYDRLQMNAGKAQKYGTQTFSNGQNQNMVWPVEDFENLEQLRQSIGLPSMDEYFKIAKDSFNIMMIWDKALTVEKAKKIRQ